MAKQTPRLMRSPLTNKIYIVTRYQQHGEVATGFRAIEKFPVSWEDLNGLGLVDDERAAGEGER